MKTGHFVFGLVALALLGQGALGQWLRQQIPGDITMILSLDFADPNIGSASGYSAFSMNFRGRALYTQDGGQQWNLAQVPDSARSLVTVMHINDSVSYIAGAYNIPGMAHSPFLEAPIRPRIRDARSISRFSLTEMGIADDFPSYRGYFLKSTNQGQTWFPHGTLPDSISYLTGGIFLNERVGFASASVQDSTRSFAVILKTTNGGMSWSTFKPAISIFSLRQIQFADSLHGVVVGTRDSGMTSIGVTLWTHDGGTTWDAQDLLSVAGLEGVCYPSVSTCYLVGTNADRHPVLIYTTNGGITWTPTIFADTALAYSVRLAPGSNTGIVCGDRLEYDTLGFYRTAGVYIMRTTNGGVTWSRQTNAGDPIAGVTVAAELLSPLEGYVAGGTMTTAAYILHTINGGITPAMVVTNPNGGEQWVSGDSYPITWNQMNVDTVKIEYSTTGSEGPWNLITSGAPACASLPESFPEMHRHGLLSPTGLYTWTIPPTILPSTNCFVRVSWKSEPTVNDTNDYPFSIITIPPPDSNWTVQTSGTILPLYAVKAVDNNVAWVGGGTGAGVSGIVLRTTNGGTIWTDAGTFPADIFCITALDANTAIAGIWTGSYARLMKTTNGGGAWRTVDSIGGGFYDYVHMFDTTNGFAWGDPVGGFWVLKRTTNTGETWFNAPNLPASPPTEAGWNNAMMWYDNNYGWFGTNSGHIYRTTSGGATWISTPVSMANTNSIWFNSLNMGIAGGSYRSTDAGATWTPLPNPLANVLAMSGDLGTQKFWGAAGNNIYYSSNFGESWSQSGPYGYTGTLQINHISMADVAAALYGWAVGNGGTIVHFRPIISDVPRDAGELPSVTTLSQNYPNPFNPVTTFQFSISNYQLTILKVYDLLGREVATLVNEWKPAGTYSVTFDVAGLSSGTYFYRLTAGSFVSTRKMIVLR